MIGHAQAQLAAVYGTPVLKATRYNWWSKYSSPRLEDTLAVDKAWDDILPAHGIVAVDHAWAAKKGLPETISLPSDPSKGAYIIDAYHQIHCLVHFL